MKKTVLFFSFILIFLVGKAGTGYSQCEPDTVNCIDVNEPGQICPTQLTDGNVGTEYLEVITIITPDSITIGQTGARLQKVVLDSILNLPTGLAYNYSSNEFIPGDRYCVSIEGTPAEEGTFFLKIYVTAHVDMGFFILPVQQVDSTSVAITIEPALGIDKIRNDEFSLIHAYPNPFMTSTKIGYLEPVGGNAELRILDMLGKQMYYEKIVAVKGENYFHFSGNDLPPGYYIYAITRDRKSLKGKLLKRE